MRRAACARAASQRLGTQSNLTDLNVVDEHGDDDLEALHAGEGEITLTLYSTDVASSIGGKVWDASLLTSAFFATRMAEHISAAASPRPRVLELGAGLGVVGLCCAQLCERPAVHMTLSDYDDAVLGCLRQSVDANSGCAGRVDVARVDFRDFGPPSPEISASLAPYAAAGMLHGFELIIASDVVYDAYHGPRLPWLCAALLTERAGARALLVLPDSRPRLAELVDAAPAAGFTCTVERLVPSPRLRRRIEAAHDGWGANGAGFSLYTLERCAEPAGTGGTGGVVAVPVV